MMLRRETLNSELWCERKWGRTQRRTQKGQRGRHKGSAGEDRVEDTWGTQQEDRGWGRRGDQKINKNRLCLKIPYETILCVLIKSYIFNSYWYLNIIHNNIIYYNQLQHSMVCLTWKSLLSLMSTLSTASSQRSQDDRRAADASRQFSCLSIHPHKATLVNNYF